MLERANTRCVLKVGYFEEGGPVECYQGDVYFAFCKYEGPNVVTELELGEGAKAIRDSMVSLGYGKGVSSTQAIRDVAGKMGLALNMPSDVPERTWENGLSFHGPARSALDKITHGTGPRLEHPERRLADHPSRRYDQPYSRGACRRHRPDRRGARAQGRRGIRRRGHGRSHQAQEARPERDAERGWLAGQDADPAVRGSGRPRQAGLALRQRRVSGFRNPAPRRHARRRLGFGTKADRREAGHDRPPRRDAARPHPRSADAGRAAAAAAAANAGSGRASHRGVPAA